MADVSNLRINQRSNVEWPNFRITRIGNKNLENLYLYQRANMRIGKITSKFLESNFGLQN